MNAQISPLILSPPVLLNSVVRTVPLSDSDAAPGDQAFLSGSCQSRTGGSATQDRKKNPKKQKYKKD